ncbi:hypothetical protein [Sphingomonas arenae]|uniref:hypothetical protein n=1 Tax=Sphingomonas arenae TaxID=2812555 RepID=UPI001967926B|nr:hypothetical protein [Sphingomonas arenae]
MTARIDQLELLARQEIVTAPVLPAPISEGCKDRTFELPTGLLLAVFGLFAAYLAVMSIGFADAGLVVPMAVNFIFVAAFAVVPMLWARMKPAKDAKALSFDRFLARGIRTETGTCGAGSASIQVLMLPAFIFLWGIAVTTIAALV